MKSTVQTQNNHFGLSDICNLEVKILREISLFLKMTTKSLETLRLIAERENQPGTCPGLAQGWIVTIDGPVTWQLKKSRRVFSLQQH